MNQIARDWKIRINRQSPLRMVERLIHIGMLLLFMGAFYHIWNSISGEFINPLEGDPFQRSVKLLGYFLAFLFVLRKSKQLLGVVVQTSYIWILIALVLLSSVWSDFPLFSLRRSLMMILTTLYGLALFVRFPFDEGVELFGRALWIALVLSMILIVLLPQLSEMEYQGQIVWRGAFTHKNHLGNYSLLSLLIFVFLWYSKKEIIAKLFWGSGIALAVVLIIGSKSTTAFVLSILLVFGSILMVLMKYVRRDWQIAFPVIGVIVLTGILIGVTNFEKIIKIFGKEITLTGRLPLWEKLLVVGREHLWLGYGFNAFWLGWQGPSAEVWADITWLPAHAHNGFLDTWLELGLVGLFFTILFLIWLFVKSYSLYFRSSKNGLFLILLMVFFVFLNLIESFLLRQDSFYWVLLVYISIYLSNTHLRKGQSQCNA